MSSSLYRIFNRGEIAGLAAGWRSVIALKPGRRWVTILDWTTLESTRLRSTSGSVSTRSPPRAIRRDGCWQRLNPQPATGYSAHRVRAAIKARLRYVRKTKTISAAVASLK